MLPLLAIIFLCCSGRAAALDHAEAAAIPKGSFKPMFGSEGQDLSVNAFWMDKTAVTNAAFAKFVAKNPTWKKERVGRDWADKNYLSHWRSTNGSALPNARDTNRPLTNVSWFAAQAYCEERGGRLPTTLEWEYAASASKTKRDASKDAVFQEQILEWYSKHGSTGVHETNFYGISGLHGLIWEWTSDFNAFFVAADNRQDGDQIKNFFCGAAATNAANREGYAAFMRYALRGSLSANFNLGSLGFRCVYD